MSIFTYQKVPKQVHIRNWRDHFASFCIHGQEEETGEEASDYNEVSQACIYRELWEQREEIFESEKEGSCYKLIHSVWWFTNIKFFSVNIYILQ